MLLGAVRTVERSQRDCETRIGDPRRDGLTAHLTLHPLMSSHNGCFGPRGLSLVYRVNRVILRIDAGQKEVRVPESYASTKADNTA
jgi:hypothetical protein